MGGRQATEMLTAHPRTPPYAYVVENEDDDDKKFQVLNKRETGMQSQHDEGYLSLSEVQLRLKSLRLSLLR